MLYSSSMMQVGAHYLFLQSIWCALGLIGCIGCAMFDYHRFRKLAPLFMGFACFLLLLVLIPHVGIHVGGARRWLGYHSIRFQPSELGKIALIIFVAWYAERNHRHMATFKKGMLIPGAIIGATLGLIFIEPDVGNTMLLGLVCALMLLIAGIRLLYFLPPVFLTLAALAAFLYHDPMRSQRIYSWLHLEETKQGKGLQAYQAMVALGSGGWNGLGLGNGRQKLGFIPEHHTDFIFSIIGEELGLIATLAVVLAFVALVICGLYIASRAEDIFGMLLASGITLMLGVQAFINIGVVTSALPNKGMPLPFISYGGSNLLMVLCAVGVLLNIARQAVDRPERVLSKNPFMEMPLAESAV